MHARALPELPLPMLAYFHLKIACRLSNVSNFPLVAGWSLLSICSSSAQLQNVFCATDTVGKQLQCSFKYSMYGRVRVCKIRPMQDSGRN